MAGTESEFDDRAGGESKRRIAADDQGAGECFDAPRQRAGTEVLAVAADGERAGEINQRVVEHHGDAGSGERRALLVECGELEGLILEGGGEFDDPIGGCRIR